MELSTQNPCNALIKRYGSHLEEMEPEDKLALRALLANFVYLIEIVDRELTLAESFRGNDLRKRCNNFRLQRDYYPHPGRHQHPRCRRINCSHHRSTLQSPMKLTRLTRRQFIVIGTATAVFPSFFQRSDQATATSSQNLLQGNDDRGGERNTPLSLVTLSLAEKLPLEQVPNLFQGGSNSPVARAIGPAEGTRTADGTKTRNWYDHIDPGDGKRNEGTFSYNPTRDGTNITGPEAADRHYAAVLLKRCQALLRQVKEAKVSLSLEEWINAIDLSNQAPESALGWHDGANPGFVANLLTMRQKGLTGQGAIVAARVESFRNVITGRYEAWTNKEGLEHDQQRRMLAAGEGMEVWQQQQAKSQPVSFDTIAFEQVEQKNPYGTQRWKTQTQQGQALYWQMGAWDGLNDRSINSQDTAYRQGYKFAQKP